MIPAGVDTDVYILLVTSSPVDLRVRRFRERQGKTIFRVHTVHFISVELFSDEPFDLPLVDLQPVVFKHSGLSFLSLSSLSNTDDLGHGLSLDVAVEPPFDEPAQVLLSTGIDNEQVKSAQRPPWQ